MGRKGFLTTVLPRSIQIVYPSYLHIGITELLRYSAEVISTKKGNRLVLQPRIMGGAALRLSRYNGFNQHIFVLVRVVQLLSQTNRLVASFLIPAQPRLYPVVILPFALTLLDFTPTIYSVI